MRKALFITLLLQFTSAIAGVNIIHKDSEMVMIEDIRQQAKGIQVIYSLTVNCKNNLVILESIRYVSKIRVIRNDIMQLPIQDTKLFQKVCS